MSRRMKYRIRAPIVVTCLYNGIPETITVPVDRVFDGDSLKRRCHLNDDGIAWAVHDWLYKTHAFDVKTDDTQTMIDNRWSADEIMYSLLKLEGYKFYGNFLQSADVLTAITLDRAWVATNENHYVRKRVPW